MARSWISKARRFINYQGLTEIERYLGYVRMIHFLWAADDILDDHEDKKLSSDAAMKKLREEMNKSLDIDIPDERYKEVLNEK